jgi:hypothetical protein
MRSTVLTTGVIHEFVEIHLQSHKEHMRVLREGGLESLKQNLDEKGDDRDDGEALLKETVVKDHDGVDR